MFHIPWRLDSDRGPPDAPLGNGSGYSSPLSAGGWRPPGSMVSHYARQAVWQHPRRPPESAGYKLNRARAEEPQVTIGGLGPKDPTFVLFGSHVSIGLAGPPTWSGRAVGPRSGAGLSRVFLRCPRARTHARRYTRTPTWQAGWLLLIPAAMPACMHARTRANGDQRSSIAG